MKSWARFTWAGPYDPASGKAEDGLILYDSKDLVTHAVCVGMTGSGKTGLCIALLEEAAIDGIPALVIDPKGDICQPAADLPGAVARRTFSPGSTRTTRASKGISPEEYARQQAELWKNGLAEWGQDGEPHPAAARRGGLRRSTRRAAPPGCRSRF